MNSGSDSRANVSVIVDKSATVLTIFLPGADGRRPVHGGYQLLGAEHHTGCGAPDAHALLTGPLPATESPFPTADVGADAARTALVHNLL